MRLPPADHAAPVSPDARSRPHHLVPAALLLGAAVTAGLLWRGMRTPPIPEGITLVEDWELSRYMGHWYEVARIDNRFEKNLNRTQAEYTALPDGSVHVLNRGYDPKRHRWSVARGKARPAQSPDVAALKVSFLGPLYGGYHVVALDEDYQWAMVIGSRLSDFWILSRTPVLPEGVDGVLLSQAQAMGVPVDQIKWVLQDGVNPTGHW